MKLILLATTGTPNGAPAAVKASGTITTVAKASLLSGEKVVISDGLGHTVEFVFDLTGSAVTLAANQTRVNVSADTTADQVRDRLIAAITTARGSQWGIKVSAVSGGAATVNVTNDYAGAHGNIAMTETVANGGFAVTGMASGALSGTPIRGSRCVEDSDFGENDQVELGVKSTAGSGVMTVQVALWGFHMDLQRWFIMHKMLAGSAIPENGGATGDRIDYSETVDGLRHYDYVYGELVAVAGTTPSYEIMMWARAPRYGLY